MNAVTFLPLWFFISSANICLAAGSELDSNPNAKAAAPNTEAETADAKEEPGILEKTRKGATDIWNNETLQKGIEGTKKVYKNAVGDKTSRDNRDSSYVSLFYIPLDYGLVLPVKSGFTGTWIVSKNWSLEAEYLKAEYGLGYSSIDLVSLSEKLISGRIRWYVANSFNLNLGLGLRKYRFSLGNDYLSKATDGEITTFPSLVVENQVVIFGLGNRWQLNNGISFGADWFEFIATVGQGKVRKEILGYVKHENDRKNINSTLNYLRYAPSFNVLKIHIGYTF